MKYGLIGEKLGHSFSKELHERISEITYDLIPLDINEFDQFMKDKAFNGINVTIPYKEKVLKYLDEISSEALKIGAVNTIINQNGKLNGYNTDYLGLKYLIEENHFILKDQCIAILGTGGTAKTTACLCKDLGAIEMILVSRNATALNISYEYLATIAEKINVIINTTPCGMYPSTNTTMLDLNLFKNLKGVIDVVYNPLNTKLVLDARKLKIKAIGGLAMLVAQGVYANEYFLNQQYDQSFINQIYLDTYINHLNIALIGMPGCGKSVIGEKLATLLNKDFVDIDHLIVKEARMPIKEIFKAHDEAYFRAIESDILSKVSDEHHQIISCGGGIIKRAINIDNLKKNSMIIYLVRDLENLEINQTRPLSSSMHDLSILYQERKDLYIKYADLIIDNNTEITKCVQNIKEKLYEYFSN